MITTKHQNGDKLNISKKNLFVQQWEIYTFMDKDLPKKTSSIS